MGDGPYSNAEDRDLRAYLKDRTTPKEFRTAPKDRAARIKWLLDWDAKHNWQEKKPWESMLGDLGRDPKYDYPPRIRALEAELYQYGYGNMTDRVEAIIDELFAFYLSLHRAGYSTHDVLKRMDRGRPHGYADRTIKL